MGSGGHVNVPCNYFFFFFRYMLLRCTDVWLRYIHEGVGWGGMLTFLVITSSSSATGCYVHRCLMSGSRGIHEGVG